MKILCKILGHKWGGCKCERCEAKREQGHQFALCSGQCTLCGKMGPRVHAWNGCTCTQCGDTRDEGHSYTSIHVENEKTGFAGFGRPVREQCARCKHVRFIEYKGSWAKNPLRVILEWPGSFLYSGKMGPGHRYLRVNYPFSEDIKGIITATVHAARPEPETSIPEAVVKMLWFLYTGEAQLVCSPSSSYLRVNFPFDGDARGCRAALHACSPEPDISFTDFAMLILGSKESLAEQMHSLFTYFAHTHNLKMGAAHLEAFGKACRLNIRLLEQCHTVLTSHEKWEADLRNGTRWGKILKKEEFLQYMHNLPVGIGNNILHLLAAKRDVSYTMEYMGDDYTTKIIGQYASVKFGDIPELAAEMLQERGEPAYSIAHYNEFPR